MIFSLLFVKSKMNKKLHEIFSPSLTWNFLDMKAKRDCCSSYFGCFCRCCRHYFQRHPLHGLSGREMDTQKVHWMLSPGRSLFCFKFQRYHVYMYVHHSNQGPLICISGDKGCLKIGEQQERRQMCLERSRLGLLVQRLR